MVNVFWTAPFSLAMYVLNMVVFQSSIFFIPLLSAIMHLILYNPSLKEVLFRKFRFWTVHTTALGVLFSRDTLFYCASWCCVLPPVNDQVLLVPENTWRRFPARGHAHYSQWVALLERTHRLKIMIMTHSQMLGKFEYTLPAKFWRLVGCTEMLSW